jgi:hypothetical protein
MAHNDVADGTRGRVRGWSWPHTLKKRLAYELKRSSFLVSSDCRLPGGWNISAGGYPVSPLLRGKELAQLIEERRRALSVEDRADPSYGPRFDFWRRMLADEQKAWVEAFGRPVHLSQ